MTDTTTRAKARTPRQCRKAGRDAEAEAAALLYADGACLVIPAHMSKGPIDLVAIYPTWVLLVQVKWRSAGARWDGVGRPALRALAARVPRSCFVELWSKRGDEAWRRERFE